jgi:hypothetical protein
MSNNKHIENSGKHMNRTITPEETEKLFAFCRQHFVYHYDLQVELVDHLGFFNRATMECKILI